MAEIIHFPHRDPDDPQALYASALARASRLPETRQAVETAYAAGYLQACREAAQMARDMERRLQEINTGLANILATFEEVQEMREKLRVE